MAKNKRNVGKRARGGSRSGVSTFYLILGIMAVLGVAVVAYAVSSGGGSGAAATAPLEMEGLDDPQQLVQRAAGVVKGDENAPITIMEFADFQCPACAQFANLVLPQVERRFVETGEARLVFHDFPLTSIHPHAFLAARAARCAQGQDRFWEYHDALYANQQDWSFANRPPVGDFVDYAENVGLNADAFEACLESDQFADLVTANQRLAMELGLQGTPTVLVSGGAGMGRRVQGNNFQSIEQAVLEIQQAQTGAAGAEDTGGDEAGDGEGEAAGGEGGAGTEGADAGGA